MNSQEADRLLTSIEGLVVALIRQQGAPGNPTHHQAKHHARETLRAALRSLNPVGPVTAPTGPAK